MACILSSPGRAGVTRVAATVHPKRCDFGLPDPRPIRAPYRAVAVPDLGWGAGEGLTGRHDLESEEDHELPLRRQASPSTLWVVFFKANSVYLLQRRWG
jgi:hypothetical protein